MRQIIETVTTAWEMQRISDFQKKEGKRIGFVPTMGFLHEGHISLIKESNKICAVTVVSIFVNPTQFAPNEDFDAYPRNLQHDMEILEENDVDYLFYPEVKEIYPDNFQTSVEVNDITRILEGKFRPAHFKGVTTIVSILFNSIKPNFAFFGQKDAQQAAVIKQMVNDLKFDVKIIVCPIVREEDGLALSSRNTYLSPEERSDSLILINTLKLAVELIKKGERKVSNILEVLNSKIAEVKSAKLDYIAFTDKEKFELAELLEDGREYFILIACKIGKVRLIDNLLVKV